MLKITVLAAALSLAAGAAVAADYKPPRMADGRPSLEGYWNNGTLTRMERDPKYGTRLNLTPEELAAIEKANDERSARLNAPTPQHKGVDDLPECQSGAVGPACGYNAGWTDPGNRVMRVGGQPRTSLITFPETGRIPPRKPDAPPVRRRLTQADAERGEGGPAGLADNPENRSLGERCIMSFGISAGPVMTSQLYNNNYQFVQTRDHLAIWVEMVHDVRIIRIGGKHRTDGVRPYMGDSIGWWEGDTLVAETINYHPNQNLRGASPNVKVTERFTRVADDRIRYQFKVEDPTVWAEPWGGEYEFAASGPVYEYACHEGNYGLEGILAGARHEEKEAAAKAAATRTAAKSD
jgi:hypothetical protein